ncbi:lamin tail domain-containing protein [Streptomyces sp. NPDC058572]|uniref:lamin tail domain-containing protein n=1 Tax=Streptomyces sp. NPDC058572 TaxID=3346546 RepID=UPI0036669C0D
MSASRTVRGIAAAALASGAVVASMATPASADDGHHRGRHWDTRSTVVLGHIQYDSPGRDDYSNRSLNAEWVDVTNIGRRSVDLDGWTLTNRDGKRYTFDDVRISGRSTIRVHTGYGRDRDGHVYQDRSTYVWGNWADKATLRDDDGRTVDTARYGWYNDDGRRHDGRRHDDRRYDDRRDNDRRHDGRRHGDRRHGDWRDNDRRHDDRRDNDRRDNDRRHDGRRP